MGSLAYAWRKLGGDAGVGSFAEVHTERGHRLPGNPVAGKELNNGSRDLASNRSARSSRGCRLGGGSVPWLIHESRFTSMALSKGP